MNSEDARGSRRGLSAAAGVVAMLAVVAIVLGAGFLLTRQLLQAGVSSTTTEASSPDRPRGRSEPQAAATPTAPAAKSGSTASSEPAETPGVLPIIRISVDDAQQSAAADTATSGSASLGLTPVRGALPTAAASGRAPQSSAPGTSEARAPLLDRISGSENAATQLNLTVPLPVTLPSSALLGGVLITVGPEGVSSAGADAFAHTLLVRAQQRRPDLGEDASLRDVAKLVLADQLGMALQRGAPAPARVQRGGVTVQVEVVATLPDTQTAALQAIGGSVGVVGVAAGLAHRVEPNYLPDLVAVAAVAYR
jgi:hypothetical protein